MTAPDTPMSAVEAVAREIDRAFFTPGPDLEAAIAAAAGRICALPQIAGVRLLELLAAHRDLSLEWGCVEEEEEPAWMVHRVSGGVNDREWELIGYGDSPASALRDAQINFGIAAQHEGAPGNDR